MAITSKHCFLEKVVRINLLKKDPKQALAGIQPVNRPWAKDLYIFNWKIMIKSSKLIALKYDIEYPIINPNNAALIITF